MRNIVGPSIKLVIFLVITMIATYILATTISNQSYGDTKSYKANFTDISGIQEGDDVRVAGVRVGSVTSIKLIKDPKDEKHRIAQLGFTVAKERPLPMTAEVHIRYRNLIGQRYLDISQGGPGDANGFLKPGGTIPTSQTTPALDLTVLFQGFGPLIKGLSAGEINNLADELIKTLQGEGGSIENLFTTVASLTNGLADNDHVIGEVIDNLTETLSIIGAHDTQLSNLIIQLRRFVSGFAADRKAIGDAITGVNNLTTTTADLLTKVRGPLAQDIKDLTGLVGVLNQNQDSIQYLLTNLAPTVAGLIRTASYGSWFNFYLCDVDGFLTLPGGKEQRLHIPTKDARCTS